METTAVDEMAMVSLQVVPLDDDCRLVLPSARVKLRALETMVDVADDPVPVVRFALWFAAASPIKPPPAEAGGAIDTALDGPMKPGLAEAVEEYDIMKLDVVGLCTELCGV